MEEKRRKPLPKTKEKVGRSYKIDLEKIKRLYLDNPNYNFKPFCDLHGWDHRYLANFFQKNDIDGAEWKQEWTRRQVKIQDDEILPDVLNLRKLVCLQRVRFVKDWTQRTAYMKTMLDAMMKRHGEDLQHDMAKTLEIQAGRTQRKFRLDAKELNEFAGAAMRLQEIETRALLLTGDKTQHAVIMANGEAQHREGPIDKEVPQLEVVTMGAAGMSGADTAKLLAQWFDQAEKKDEPKNTG